MERGSVAWTASVHEASRLTSSRSVRLFTCQRAHKQLHTSVKTFVFSVVFPVRGGGILSSQRKLSTAVAKIFPAAKRSSKSAVFASNCHSVANATGSRHLFTRRS